MASSWRPNWAGFVLGLVIAGGALSVSVGSFQGASRGGGPYVVLWGAVLAGAALALSSLTRTRGQIEADTERRVAEARVASLKRSMSILGPGAWEAAKLRHIAAAGHLLSEAEIANRVIVENHAREEERLARWRANAAAAYAPIVNELKPKMTAEEWEAKRLEATDSMRRSRLRAARYWLENVAPFLQPELRTFPEDLDPATVPLALDWQVALDLRPIELDNDGNPIATSV